MSQVFFTADLHLGHGNIIKYCNRPFGSVAEMDKTIIENINARVGEKDTLYILGDFAFSKDRVRWPYVWENYRKQIRCQHLVLVLGNHDPHMRQYEPDRDLYPLFEKVAQALLVRIPFDGNGTIMPWENPEEIMREQRDRQIYLHHYACRVWPHSHHGSFMAFGHSHGILSDEPTSLSADVGIDAVARRYSDGESLPCNYRPIDFTEFCQWMSQKNYQPPFLRLNLFGGQANQRHQPTR